MFYNCVAALSHISLLYSMLRSDSPRHVVITRSTCNRRAHIQVGCSSSAITHSLLRLLHSSSYLLIRCIRYQRQPGQLSGYAGALHTTPYRHQLYTEQPALTGS